MEQDLIPLDASPASLSLTLQRDPARVIAEAQKAAAALKGIVDAKPDKVVMNGETYLECEDWQTVGAFFGCTAKVRETRLVDYGGVRGFEAVAEVIVMATGQVIGSAESMCLNDEEKWSSRPKYEWFNERDAPPGKPITYRDGEKKRVKVLIDSVPVPLFQLRSMAQTRACAKALRTVFAWVVVLAGYKPTVAEELTGDEEPGERTNGKRTPVSKPGRRSEATGAITDGAKAIVTKKQAEKNVTDEALNAELGASFGVERLEDLPMTKVNDLLVWLDKQGVPA